MTPSTASAREALAATKIVMNLTLPEMIAASMRLAETKPMPIKFEGEQVPANGWIVADAPADSATREAVLGRVTKAPRGAFSMVWGKATKAGDHYTWLETMQGSCALAGEEVLK
jgi:hypothetical protein